MKKMIAVASVLLALCIGGMPIFAADAAKPAANSAKTPAMMTEEELVAYLKSLSVADFAKAVASAVRSTNRSFGIRAVSAAMTVMNSATAEKRAEYVAELKKTVPALVFVDEPGLGRVAMVVTPANSIFTNTMGADASRDAIVGGNSSRITNPSDDRPTIGGAEEEEEERPLSRPARKRRGRDKSSISY